ncbi:histone lysine methyltransferase Set9 [Microbotryomycetes sp. JL221]|nr:histone lysine methyltransferase Set9 [Microbotryomycetes sp. JL221]
MSFVAVNAAVNAQWLSAADDLCSRIFLDLCIFDEPKVDGRRTGKMDMRGKAEPRLSDADLSLARDVVRKLRTGQMTAGEATDKLCNNMAYFKTFVNKWDPDDEDLFKVHVKRYCYAMRPDSGIAFHETDRYTRSVKTAVKQAIDSPSRAVAAAAAAATAHRSPDTFIEVGVFATRNYKKGEVIYLRGGVADLSEEEDDKMREDGGRSDFSVLWSDRKKCFCLLLGPARFVNHDCRNNVVFQLTGSNMAFKVIEDIKMDEEIFTHYGDHYFDMNNARCLCASCQRLKRGAFTSKSAKAALAAAELAKASGTAVASPSQARRPPTRSMTPSKGSSRGTPIRELAPRAARPTGNLNASPSVRQSLEKQGTPLKDELRNGIRLVHPRLKPPPGYEDVYEFDEKRKMFKYIGPRTIAVKKKKIVVVEQESKDKKGSSASGSKASKSTVSNDSRRRSSTTNGKRKREDGDDDSNMSSPAPTPRKRVTVTRTVQLKPVRLGTRTSARTSVAAASASGRQNAFERLKRALGQHGASDDDELSEMSESDSGPTSARRIGRGNEVLSETVEVELQLTLPADDSKVTSPSGMDEQEREVEAMLLPNGSHSSIDPDSPIAERPPSLDPAPLAFKGELGGDNDSNRGSSASVPPVAPRHPDLSVRQFSPTESPVPECQFGAMQDGSEQHDSSGKANHIAASSSSTQSASGTNLTAGQEGFRSATA